MYRATYRKPSKYKNEPIIIDGYKFPSKREANRYRQLSILQKAGIIHDLKLQEPFELQPHFQHPKTGKMIRSIKYIADFTYIDDQGNYHIEDVKGSEATMTKDFKIKRKMFIYKYGMDIEIV